MERVFSIAFAVAMIAVPVGLWVWSLRRHARQGGMFDWAKARVARLEVPGSTQDTRELVYRGLYEALGTRTPPRKKHREDFKIRSHLDGDFGLGSALFRFELQALNAERTQLTISLPTMHTGQGPPHPDEAPARVEQVDRLARWFVDTAGCRLLETRWGKG
ncbi:hypothetical protein DVA67_032740 [Solirubrobacter sp. CPCC 204708]|uniref:DUF2550 family protein n=1 Tax=Solirubrobacter deserti TaxID=2282478 RepID=A0ABT4RUD1_9ACTN|nr:hypothetical protein [Solirubrobacter deserti]MBE2320773.1 hypothetical protein [Solirubrobacter deserti]MDA0141876.1 hypothetical protein [Solirubrobacter deserti]